MCQSGKRPSFIAWSTSTRDVYRVLLRLVAPPEFAWAECLSCQSQPSLFRAKESPLNNEIVAKDNHMSAVFFSINRLNYAPDLIASNYVRDLRVAWVDAWHRRQPRYIAERHDKFSNWQGVCVLNMVSTIKTSLAPILGQRRNCRSMVDVLNNSFNNATRPIRPNPFLQLWLEVLSSNESSVFFLQTSRWGSYPEVALR